MVKLPGYIVEFQIALDGVKRYTGWTDVEYVEKIPAKGRGDMRRCK